MKTDLNHYTIVKIGGSLFTWKNFKHSLKGWLESQRAKPLILIAGGGLLADQIRYLQTIHEFDDHQAHWQAIQTLSLSARFVHDLLPHLKWIDNLDQVNEKDGHYIFDCRNWLEQTDPLPHSWEVTSDSIAAKLAIDYRMNGLILLKSVPLPKSDSVDWHQLAQRQMIDQYFAKIVETDSCQNRLSIDWVNLRDWQGIP